MAATMYTSPKRISDVELKRRWSAVREEMKASNLDFLILQNSSSNLAGNVKWLTDISISGSNRPVTVIFPREDDMIVIQRALRPSRESGSDPELRGVKKQIFVPIFWNSLTYSLNFDAEKVVAELNKYGNCRIGWAGLGYISASFYKYVTEHLTGARFEDAMNTMDRLRAIKSDDEITLIRETCDLEDKLFDWVMTIVDPGETDVSLKNKIVEKCAELGAETHIEIRSAPAGSAPRPGPIPSPGDVPRTICDGDQLTFLLETSSPTGYWGELSRTICLGNIPAKLQEQFELAKEAQQATLDLLKPGVPSNEFWEANNTFLRNKGYPEENRIYAHGQGYDIVERPCLDPDESMKIEANMFLAVHPEVKSNSALGWICDNYLVKKSGKPEHFHKTLQKIFTI